jgi:hypothetical protein
LAGRFDVLLGGSSVDLFTLCELRVLSLLHCAVDLALIYLFKQRTRSPPSLAFFVSFLLAAASQRAKHHALREGPSRTSNQLQRSAPLGFVVITRSE